MVLLILLPVGIFMSVMSKSMWNIFYGSNPYGESMIRFTVLVAVIDATFMVINSLLQGLNKTKIIYFSVISGILLNLVLDVPLMYLFSNLGIPAYYGAIAATFIGTLSSVVISMAYINSKIPFNYSETYKILPRLIISIILMIGMLIIFNKLLPMEHASRFMHILKILISGIVTGGLYLFINFKYIKEILPERLLKKLKIN